MMKHYCCKVFRDLPTGYYYGPPENLYMRVEMEDITEKTTPLLTIDGTPLRVLCCPECGKIALYKDEGEDDN